MQPSAWKNWVETPEDKFDTGALSNANDFFNSAVIKYNGILNDNGGSFDGSLTTVLEDTVAMTTKVVESLKKKSASQPASNKESTKKKSVAKKEAPTSASKNKNQPSFITDEKNSSGKPYKVGDKKMHGNVPYYFCDFPRHRWDRRWHAHTAEDCSSRQKWLAYEKNSPSKKAKATANLGEDEEGAVNNNDANEEAAPTGVMGHLSEALSVADDQTKALIAMMIDTINHE